MARPTNLRGTKLLIKLGDGATPENFTAWCGMSTKKFGREAGVNEFDIADCSDPDAPIWTERVKKALSSTISGGGTQAKESLDAFEEFFEAAEPRNIQITLDYAVGPRTYQGKYLMTKYDLTGEQDGLVQSEMEWQSSGPVERV